MSNYKIITDAACDLTPELIEQLGIIVIPMEVRFGEQSYFSFPDGRDITAHDFYDRLRRGESALTSQVKLSEFVEYFTPVLEAGEDILYISFSSGLSGTYNASLLAKDHFADIYPERRICSVDTLAASLGEGLLVYNAALLQQQGKSMDEIADWVMENRLHLVHLFTVDDLNHLHRGGRCSSLAAFLGTMLNIKPLLHVDDAGFLIPQEKVRTRKKVFENMISKMADNAHDLSKQIVFISHGDDWAGAQMLADMIKEKLGVERFVINQVCPLIGSHSGPGTIALFFFGEKR